jgi:hypothetical protein
MLPATSLFAASCLTPIGTGRPRSLIDQCRVRRACPRQSTTREESPRYEFAHTCILRFGDDLCAGEWCANSRSTKIGCDRHNAEFLSNDILKRGEDTMPIRNQISFLRAATVLIISVACWMQSTPSAAQTRCNHGYVWREAFPGDYVCVTPAVRRQAQEDNAAAGSRYEEGEHGPFTCLAPYVWREAFPGDMVCVTTDRREQVRRENVRAGTVTQSRPSGGSRGSTPIQGQARGAVPSDDLVRAAGCKSGFVWREAAPRDRVCVEPTSRQQVQEENAQSANRNMANRCKSGFVWREARPEDFVCVTPSVRDQTHQDNMRHPTRIGRFDKELVECERYGREAVAQFHDMRARSCGHSGPRWQDNYDAHFNWCLTAAEVDRGGEAGARRKQLRDCVARTGNQNGAAPGEQCLVSVIVRNKACSNVDGTPSSKQAGESTAPGCGNSVEAARARAKLNFFGGFGPISEDDPPSPGSCSISEETVNGCLCR